MIYAYYTASLVYLILYTKTLYCLLYQAFNAVNVRFLDDVSR